MDPPPRRTLMEKWKEHYNTKDEMFNIKPETANIAGVIFTWGYMISLMYTVLNIMIPQLARYQSSKQWWMSSFTWFVTVEIIINWILTARKTISQVNAKSVPQGNEKLVTSLPEGWKSCPTCQLDAPPRSHHCKICKMCVLKRDHHCFFTGSCIGFYNQRYFIIFLFYATAGIIFSTYLLFTYLADPLPLLSRHCISYFFPVAIFQWLLGYLSFAHLFLVAQLNASILCVFGSLWFFVWEMAMTARGQTSFEVMRGIERYRMGITKNFQSVFGHLWMLNFIIPMPFAVCGNGVDWKVEGVGKSK